MIRFRYPMTCLLFLTLSCPVSAQDSLGDVTKPKTDSADPGWPTYRHDNRRSGVSDQTLVLPISQRWVWRSSQPPQTAWSGPAKWDAYTGNSGLQSMRNFDPCFYVTADANHVYFGSSADDAVHALDARSGVEDWVYFTGGPVRMPPTIDESRLLFGSDDGFVYCCDRTTGDEIWRKRVGPVGERIVNDRKLISLWPVRTGVLVDQGLATFAASLVPWETSHFRTVRSEDGDSDAQGCFRRELTGVTLQGALLASPGRFYVPQGRAAPLAFARLDGQPQGAVGEAGGVFCILTEDEMLFAGPHNQKTRHDEIRVADLNSKQAVASFAGTNRILVDGDEAWMSIGGELKSLNRAQFVSAQRVERRAKDDLKNGRQPAELMKSVIDKATKDQNDAWRWKVALDAPLDMIKLGDVLVVGLEGSVSAISAASGRELWQADVEGAAHGLAAANGQLFVSTDRGQIYAFGASN